jgi:hypothetical protein
LKSFCFVFGFWFVFGFGFGLNAVSSGTGEKNLSSCVTLIVDQVVILQKRVNA